MHRPSSRFLWVVASLAAPIACVTAPPPDLPSAAPHRPTIYHDAVLPSAAVPFFEWPLESFEFVVPVEIDDPSIPVFYEVFVDYDPVTPGASTPVIAPTSVAQPPSAFDGGTAVVSFHLARPPETTFCHRIDFLVAFSFPSPHSPDSSGGDIVSWVYAPGGNLFGCPQVPAPDAGVDGDADGGPIETASDAVAEDEAVSGP